MNGDRVLVAPGTYKENINFNGKAIVVRSSGGPKVTNIDGGSLRAVVTFSTGETNGSVLSGFTLQHGSASGLYMNFASPVVKNNIIANNKADWGAGMYIGGASRRKSYAIRSSAMLLPTGEERLGCSPREAFASKTTESQRTTEASRVARSGW